MKVLIVKTSSLGDIIHTFPALTDAARLNSGIKFDWVVEESFADVPIWNSFVDKVIPVSIRKWRKRPLYYMLNGEIRDFLKNLRLTKYNKVIDAQGLIKSGVLTQLARANERIGLDKLSLTEPLARFCYKKTFKVDLSKQAVFRMRSIFAQSLNYQFPKTIPDFGFNKSFFPFKEKTINKNIMFIHGTTWASKLWPDKYWKKLARLVSQNGYKVILPWHEDTERQRVEFIAKDLDNVEILPPMNLTELMKIISKLYATVSVDTGLGHLSAALNIPTFALFGPTNPDRTGMVGDNVKYSKPNFSYFDCKKCDKPRCKKLSSKCSALSSLCMMKLKPLAIWKKLQVKIDKGTIDNLNLKS